MDSPFSPARGPVLLLRCECRPPLEGEADEEPEEEGEDDEEEEDEDAVEDEAEDDSDVEAGDVTAGGDDDTDELSTDAPDEVTADEDEEEAEEESCFSLLLLGAAVAAAAEEDFSAVWLRSSAPGEEGAEGCWEPSTIPFYLVPGEGRWGISGSYITGRKGGREEVRKEQRMSETVTEGKIRRRSQGKGKGSGAKDKSGQERAREGSHTRHGGGNGEMTDPPALPLSFPSLRLSGCVGGSRIAAVEGGMEGQFEEGEKEGRICITLLPWEEFFPALT